MLKSKGYEMEKRNNLAMWRPWSSDACSLYKVPLNKVNKYEKKSKTRVTLCYL